MKKEKSKVILGILSSAVGICLVLHIFINAASQKYVGVKTDIQFKIVEESLGKAIVQYGVTPLFSHVAKVDGSVAQLELSRPLLDHALLINEMTHEVIGKIDKLRDQEAQVTRKLKMLGFVERGLISLAIILNLYAIYYGGKIARLYVT